MESNLAVLIDFENIAAGAEREHGSRFDVSALMERITDKGRVLIARSYADWGRFAKYKQTLLTSNVTMMELTAHGVQNKNRADIAMVVDALELAFTKDYIDTFVVVSGDSDFTPMVLKMRELNKRVIGLGLRGSTSRLLIQACDEFIFYDAIVKSQRHGERIRVAATPDTAPPPIDPLAMLAEVVVGLERENMDAPLASIVKSAILRKLPDFSESDFGFPTFGKFLEAARDRGHIRLTKDTKSGSWRVSVASAPEEEPATRQLDQGEDHLEWNDPQLPKGVEEFVEVLTQDGLNPLSSETRLAILQAMTETIEERRRKNRRVNMQYVQEDVRRRIRKSHPEVPPRALRAVFRALLQSGALEHPEGGPIRTLKAPFISDSTPEELNKALAGVYLETLADSEAEVRDVQAMSQLLFGNESADEVAWIHGALAHQPAHDMDELMEEALLVAEAAPSEAPPRREVEIPSDDDLDALLSFDE
ncbi:MAG: NYN domain-containing protein [Deltaproteobacteria bacterium]|nr:NYN domain-containing protein [Deltaproteobacteria bacterium]